MAEVSWQLNPDGRYYMDDDGFGMTSDEEITVYGFIDTKMNVLVKFQYIDKDWKRLDKMRREAEKALKNALTIAASVLCLFIFLFSCYVLSCYLFS